ncbi:GNAT family N-acetyltransferase (plasmid) [Haloferax mediterranei ATCC 33500]|uniref:GNAT family N-acetyltransferase n=1 Tax=Haloferax mediterranei (strain ATCC 33500 / DSM 1411 / JCM 8866 / NBRC 14739 / NCIMB 2177 / R-4) TaxID=523841 RepID=I3RAU9_HALMT|nr:GNAT family N-acetyltransferase [Haloferax mediterranei]AFK21359.1 hypothetical protein HFX_6236 [Haloferax mediterranei ATCC 33500]AHZ24559.1 hypothetical protein BM92_16785 [Haloferax mediterranei ATCC 33500]ELZ97315.1 hypothetical protein C439_18373 [Haloferax mediterranei ATCC 33500]MDX5990388.1 GNAT family N-acetyltransferase [Haloferax mediterranei ATCC 33500]QCQ76952.1 GNAT family N-acetyltransferase [Haloferax mediterranei ATCC 33500]
MSQPRIETLGLEEWEQALPSSGVEVFHTSAVLAAIDEHFDGEMHLFGVFKGQEPVALFPTFVRKNPLGRAVVSPPPSMAIPYIGPIMMPNSPKQSTYESVNRKFADLVLEELGVRDKRTFVRVLCSPSYLDPRPFEWTGFAVKPSFTYRLDLSGQSPDEVQSQFSSSLRREIRQAKELDISISNEGIDGARTVYDDVASRYDEQDEPFGMPWAFVEALVRNLGDRCRVYVARDPDGRYLSGIIVPFSNETAYFWLGGARGEYDGVSINSLLHWRIIEDIVEDDGLESVMEYDLVGANTERLCNYKSKFGGELVPYYVVESTGVGMSLAKRTYQFLSKSSERIAK